MKIFKYTAVVAMFMASAAAFANDEMAQEKPSMYSSETITVTAVVEAINHETREVTLRKNNGEVITFTASEEARNLPQVGVGDIVSANLTQSVSIEVMEDDGKGPRVAELGAMDRTDEGAMPGGAVISATVVVASVEEINIEANTFKLLGPDGVVNEYTARNPENLKRASVGDLVVITVAESMAISVEKVPAQ
jgi:hypothetical protein